MRNETWIDSGEQTGQGVFHQVKEFTHSEQDQAVGGSEEENGNQINLVVVCRMDHR